MDLRSQIILVVLTFSINITLWSILFAIHRLVDSITDDFHIQNELLIMMTKRIEQVIMATREIE